MRDRLRRVPQTAGEDGARNPGAHLTSAGVVARGVGAARDAGGPDTILESARISSDEGTRWAARLCKQLARNFEPGSKSGLHPG
jgi:hypothetical protein